MMDVIIAPMFLPRNILKKREKIKTKAKDNENLNFIERVNGNFLTFLNVKPPLERLMRSGYRKRSPMRKLIKEKKRHTIVDKIRMSKRDQLETN